MQPDTLSRKQERDRQAEEIRRWQGPLDEASSEVLTRVYADRRLAYQVNYYRAKAMEFEESSDTAFRAGAIILSLTSVLAAISTNSAMPPFLHLLTAILPALAALIASFRALYQWDRQSQLYRDTILGLERASLILPDLDQVDSKTAAQVFPDLVEAAESVFYDEVNQWGQIALGDEDKEGEAEESIIAFARDYGIDIYTDDGEIDDKKVASIRQMLQVSQSPVPPPAMSLPPTDAFPAAQPAPEPVPEPHEITSGAPTTVPPAAPMPQAPMSDAGAAYTPQAPMSDAGAAYTPQAPMSDAGAAYTPQAPMSDADAAYTPQAPVSDAGMSDAGAAYTPQAPMSDAGAAYTPEVPDEVIQFGSDAPPDDNTSEIGFAYDMSAPESSDAPPGMVETAEPAPNGNGAAPMTYGSDAPVYDYDDETPANGVAFASDAPPDSEWHTPNGHDSAAFDSDAPFAVESGEPVSDREDSF